MSPPSPARAGARPRWRRRALIAGGLFALVVAALVASVLAIASNLEQAWVKRRLQAAIASAAGLELDYAAARVGAGGLTLRGLELRSPEAVRAHAPLLVRIAEVDASWRAAVLRSASPKVDRVTVRGVELWVVLDASGRSSFDLGPPPASPTPPSPRSALLEELLGKRLPIGALEVAPISVTLLRTDGAALIERYLLTGLELALEAQASKDGGRALIHLGEERAPLPLTLVREGQRRGQLRATLWAGLTADRGSAKLDLALRVLEQDLVRGPRIDRLIGLSAEARFSPKAQRIELVARELVLGDGALAASAELELPDEDGAAPLIRRAHLELAAPRLVALVPEDLRRELPSFREGEIEADVAELELATMPRLRPQGSIKLLAHLRGIEAARAGLKASAPLVDIDALLSPDESVKAKILVELAAASYEDRGTRLRTRGGRLSLAADGLRQTPDGVAGKLSVGATLAELAANAGKTSMRLDDLRLDVGGALALRPPFGANAALRAGRAQLSSDGRALLDTDVALELKASGVVPDLARPIASRGSVQLSGTLGAIALTVDAKKAADALDYSASLSGAELGLVGNLIGDLPGLQIGWRKMGASLRSSGQLTRLAGRAAIQHDTTLELTHPALTSQAGALAAAALALSVKSSGDQRRHEGSLALSVRGLERGGKPFGDGRIEGKLAVDMDAPRLSLDVTSSGPGAPAISLRAELDFDRHRRRLGYDFSLKLGKLEPLAAALGGLKATRGFQLPGLELAASGKGTVEGLIEAIDAEGTPRLAKDPLRRIGGDAKLELHVAHLSWQDQDKEIEASVVDWRGVVTTEGDRRELRGQLHIPELGLAFGETRLELEGIADQLHVALTGDPRDGVVQVEDRLGLQSLKQAIAPEYVTAQLMLSLEARRDKEGVVHVDKLRFENPAGGTSLSLTGGLDLGENRRSFSLKGAVEQDLAKAWTDRQVLIGRGQLSTEMRLDSGDLRVFRASASLRIKDGYLELPKQKIKLDTVNGEIPVVMDRVLTKDGLRPVRKPAMNSYAELRFIDQHPLQSRRSFLSIVSLMTPWATIAPIAGNIMIDNDVLELSQLELGVRDGRVSGRCAVVFQGQDRMVQASVRASGVRSSRGEPFDGNASLVLNVKQRSVQGRAEVLRIGKRHLLDILDVVDPPRADPAINRVRRALALGYPTHMRVAFNRGFASAKIDLGGLAKLVSIDEIKGIPMGPIIEQLIGPFIEPEEE